MIYLKFHQIHFIAIPKKKDYKLFYLLKQSETDL